ncbi:MAG: shikimate dehydrogenase [Halanaerobiales bacterium]
MIDIKTGILGLIGYPIEHSLSPLLHNMAIKKYDLNYVYLPFAVEPGNVKQALMGLKALNFRGVNVTIPYKEKVIPYLDEMDSLAEKIGAVNTIVNENGILKGYNTDITGLKRMIEVDGNTTIKNKKALIIGAGGAAKAAVFALCLGGIKEIAIINRTAKRADEIAKIVKQYYDSVKLVTGSLDTDLYKHLLTDIDLVIDTTPVGMAPKADVAPVIELDGIKKSTLVIDLVYNPAKTTILKEAEKRNAETMNGLNMLLYQGAESFKIWTGIDINTKMWYNYILKLKKL